MTYNLDSCLIRAGITAAPKIRKDIIIVIPEFCYQVSRVFMNKNPDAVSVYGMTPQSKALLK